MDNPLWVEIVGYTGSALVVLSLTRKSILKLRTYGLAASTVFLIYSLIIEAYPIAAVNVVVAAVHLYFLVRLTRRQNEVFSMLRIYPESRYLEAFLDFHSHDIARFQPEFTYRPDEDLLTTLVLRDMVPAGLVIGRPSPGATSIEILLDYAIPQYRDFKLGKFLYSAESGIFASGAFVQASATATTEAHAAYLEKVGFRRAGKDTFVLDAGEAHGPRVASQPGS